MPAAIMTIYQKLILILNHVASNDIQYICTKTNNKFESTSFSFHLAIPHYRCSPVLLYSSVPSVPSVPPFPRIPLSPAFSRIPLSLVFSCMPLFSLFLLQLVPFATVVAPPNHSFPTTTALNRIRVRLSFKIEMAVYMIKEIA